MSEKFKVFEVDELPLDLQTAHEELVQITLEFMVPGSVTGELYDPEAERLTQTVRARLSEAGHSEEQTYLLAMLASCEAQTRCWELEEYRLMEEGDCETNVYDQTVTNNN